ncbi:MAG: ABC transporter ATP-binding protein [Oscillospiraceae bacterium]|jgi:ABC-2 type transport system ATP-binding protein|nr:ABC transporter ATP-binding protein [Oscillospiraceae bacterium]
MISVASFTKKFDGRPALDNISLNISDNSVYGLLGSNGSGKSTLLRSIAGVYTPDGGDILADGKTVFKNLEFKNSLFFVSDEPFYFAQSSLTEMSGFYKKFYTGWNENTYRRLCEVFPLDASARIAGFSKGMKRQALIILSLSCSPRYLLLDEAFDGLDPVMRSALKKVIAEKIADSSMTVIVTSHNVGEFENLCDTVAIIHKGRKVLERENSGDAGNIVKAQLAFAAEPDAGMFRDFDVLNFEMRGRLATLTIRGGFGETQARLEAMNPLFLDILPTTLEEIFIYEMEAAGYGASKLI